jgi:hypothetical protein
MYDINPYKLKSNEQINKEYSQEQSLYELQVDIKQTACKLSKLQNLHKTLTGKKLYIV